MHYSFKQLSFVLPNQKKIPQKAQKEAVSKLFLERKQRKMRKLTQSYQLGIQQITFWFTNLICDLRAFVTFVVKSIATNYLNIQPTSGLWT